MKPSVKKLLWFVFICAAVMVAIQLALALIEPQVGAEIGLTQFSDGSSQAFSNVRAYEELKRIMLLIFYPAFSTILGLGFFWKDLVGIFSKPKNN